MQDTHRIQEERARPIYRRVHHPRASTGVLRSKVERGNLKSFGCRWLVSSCKLAITQRWRLNVPPKGGLVQSPELDQFIGAVRRTFKVLKHRSSRRYTYE